MAAEDLLTNKLFLQYLAGAGGAIGSGQSVAPALAGVTQQNIQSQNLMKLLRQALGPDGSKMTADATGLTFKTPQTSELLSTFLSGDQPFKVDQSLATTTPAAPTSTPVPTPTTPQGGGLSTINPFVIGQPDLSTSPSDLAGLTPQDIGMVLSAKHAQDTLKQQSVRDMIDSLYKGSVVSNAAEELRLKKEAAPIETAYKKALTSESEARTLENTPSIVVPGTSLKLTPKDYLAYQKLTKENQTPAVKNYEYALQDGFKGSFMEFQDAAKTGNQKDYDAAVAGGYKGSFNSWLLDLRKAGAINLGMKVEEKKALSDVERQNKVLDPGFASKTVDHLSKTLGMSWDYPTGYKEFAKTHNIPDQQAATILQRQLHRREMNAQITQVYPTAQWVDGKGWMVDGKLVVKDPYVK